MRQNVGSYEIVRVLARGGMAIVYLAHQPALDRDVALKQLDLQGTDPMLAQRFVREARLAAGLDHPNIVTLFDFFQDAGVPYIAMEYVGAGSLRPLVGALTLPQVFGILEGMLAGLAHAEAKSISHRDLKPENVLITRGGTVKLADFGIARAYDALTPSFTSTGTMIGTPVYMAPEQALDEPLGPATDIYALGVVAYELLAGRPPFEPGQTPMAVLYCHIHKPPPPLAELAPDVPEPVCRWVEWMLAKQPEDRPASAAEAWEALEEIAVAELGPYWRRAAAIAAPEERDDDRETLVDVPSQPTTPAPAGPPPEPPRRRRRLAIAAAAGLAATTAAVAFLALGSDPPDPTPSAAAASGPPATPYDFNGDDRQELAIGMPGSGADHEGVVVIRSGRRSDPGADEVLTAADAGLSPLTGDEDFGTSIASADFDDDGHADLAVSAPGRDLVAVIHGTGDGLSTGRVERIHARDVRFLKGAGRFGSRLLATEMNGDAFADLVIGAPASDAGPIGSGVIQILFGSRGGIREGLRQTINRPVEDWVGFGTKLRAGDINGDGRIDLVEGSPDGAAAGHASTCISPKKGRRVACKPLIGPVSSGTSALAVADVDGDGNDDVVQGDAFVEPAAAAEDAAVGGEVRIWRGGRDGVVDEPIVIDQRAIQMPGQDEPGDEFGFGVDAGDLDGDGFADIVVSAPGEDSAAGAVSVIRGGSAGHARDGHTRFFRQFGIPGRPVPGEALGWSTAVLDVTGDDRLDVAVSIRGADRLQDSVYLLEGGRGSFVPGETRPWRPLRGRVDVADPLIERIRFGRVDGA